MPPVLDIALGELAGGCAQQVFAHQRGLGMDERHAVLQLVAEAEGTARLVVAAARPEPAGQGLIEQPAVGQDVERGVRGLHLHRAQGVRPMLADRFQLGPRGRGAATAMQKAAGVVRAAPPDHAQPEDDGARLPMAQVEGRLERAAGIQRGTDLAGQTYAVPARPAGRASRCDR